MPKNDFQLRLRLQPEGLWPRLDCADHSTPFTTLLTYSCHRYILMSFLLLIAAHVVVALPAILGAISRTPFNFRCVVLYGSPSSGENVGVHKRATAMIHHTLPAHDMPNSHAQMSLLHNETTCTPSHLLSGIFLVMTNLSHPKCPIHSNSFVYSTVVHCWSASIQTALTQLKQRAHYDPFSSRC